MSQSLWPHRDVGLPSQGCRCLGWVPPWDEPVLSVGISPIAQKSNIYVRTSPVRGTSPAFWRQTLWELKLVARGDPAACLPFRAGAST